jgi:hypothetical protein
MLALMMGRRSKRCGRGFGRPARSGRGSVRKVAGRERQRALFWPRHRAGIGIHALLPVLPVAAGSAAAHRGTRGLIAGPGLYASFASRSASACSSIRDAAAVSLARGLRDSARANLSAAQGPLVAKGAGFFAPRVVPRCD